MAIIVIDLEIISSEYEELLRVGGELPFLQFNSASLYFFFASRTGIAYRFTVFRDRRT